VNPKPVANFSAQLLCILVGFRCQGLPSGLQHCFFLLLSLQSILQNCGNRSKTHTHKTSAGCSPSKNYRATFSSAFARNFLLMLGALARPPSVPNFPVLGFERCVGSLAMALAGASGPGGWGASAHWTSQQGPPVLGVRPRRLVDFCNSPGTSLSCCLFSQPHAACRGQVPGWLVQHLLE
jgi:hypothetical protein